MRREPKKGVLRYYHLKTLQRFKDEENPIANAFAFSEERIIEGGVSRKWSGKRKPRLL